MTTVHITDEASACPWSAFGRLQPEVSGRSRPEAAGHAKPGPVSLRLESIYETGGYSLPPILGIVKVLHAMRFNVSLINRMAREAENFLFLSDFNLGFYLSNKCFNLFW